MEIVYTDGACSNNQHKHIRTGGYGVFFGDNDPRNKSIKLTGDKITNQVAELTACICAIETVLETNNTVNLTIKTDSMYTINCVDTWFDGWKKRGWKKADGKSIENLELIQTLHNYKTLYNVKFIHVRAHKNEPAKNDPSYNDWYGNMMADKLATSA
jgi:ribonuclease HI